MVITKWARLSIISFVFFQGCSENNNEKIANFWSCRMAADNANGTANIEYVKNGDLSGDMIINGQDSGIPFSISATFSGNWQIENESIYEKINNLVFTNAKLAGVNVPPNLIPDEMKQVLIGSATTSQIIKLDDENLITRSPDGTTTCRRRR